MRLYVPAKRHDRTLELIPPTTHLQADSIDPYSQYNFFAPPPALTPVCLRIEFTSL
jgi:hypothetical protein